jgi:hypothetical protein
MKIVAALAALAMLAIPVVAAPAAHLGAAATVAGLGAVLAAASLAPDRLPARFRALSGPPPAARLAATTRPAAAIRSAVRSPAGTLAAGTAIASCALWHPATAILAGEGLAILGYLVLLDAPSALRPAVAGRWAARQLRYLLAGLAATGAVLLVLAFPGQPGGWAVLAGLAAAVAGYWLAVPRRAGK